MNTTAISQPDMTLFSIPEVVARLNTGRTRLYDLINSGQLPVVKLGARTFVRPSDLASFIESLPVAQPHEHLRHRGRGRPRKTNEAKAA